MDASGAAIAVEGTSIVFEPTSIETEVLLAAWVATNDPAWFAAFASTTNANSTITEPVSCIRRRAVCTLPISTGTPMASLILRSKLVSKSGSNSTSFFEACSTIFEYTFTNCSCSPEVSAALTLEDASATADIAFSLFSGDSTVTACNITIS
jgi:hypothetical protein